MNVKNTNIFQLQDTGVNIATELALESSSNKLLNTLYPPDEVYYRINQQPEDLLNNVKHNNDRLSNESISSPFSENPISKTIEEMQRVLNARGDCFPETTEPSPEEILNIYSENLGISVSCNGSPRAGDTIQHQYQTTIDDLKSNKSKRDKNNLKQPKSKCYTTKQDSKKGKIPKSDMATSKENKLRELINVYGGSEKIRKPYSDLTLCSKSEEKRNISPNTPKPTNNSSNKVSSIPSRKSRRKKQKHINKNDNYLNDLVLEKSSRLSSKRKTNPKANLNNLKKGNLKRKLKLNTTKVDFEPKLSRNFPISSKENKHCANKVNNSISNKQLQLKNKAPNQMNKKVHSYPQDSKRNTLSNNINKIGLNVTSRNALNIEPEIGMKHHDLDILQNHSNQYNKCKLGSSEKVIDFLSKKASTEANLNKHTLFAESSPVDRNDSFTFDIQDSQNDHLKHDSFNEGFASKPTQLHYALPTQSSRSKEVDRFLNGHYQHLPFVIGQSTNKSHNLWVNIQEALSLIKQKLQQPTETPNTTLNDCVECERPPSVLSKLTTKTTVRKTQQCPAVRSDSLYDIPEGTLEIEETGVSSWEDHPECIKANVDPNYVRSRCSCLAQPVMNYKNVLRQIFGGNSEGASGSNMTINGVKGDVFNDQGGDSYIIELKKALIGFTQDFEEMNK